MTHTTLKTIGAAAALSLALMPIAALAESADAGVGATVRANVAGVSAGADARVSLSARADAAKGKAGQEIDRRVSHLTALSARIDAMKNLSDSDKTTIHTVVTSNVDALSQLKAKIDADADAETLRTDIKSIASSYRVYALIMPQIRIIAAADRVVSVAGTMQAFSAKLHARVSAAEASGADMTAAVSALADFDAKVSDAQTQAQAAVTAIATLSPDAGDKAAMEANTKALADARAKVVAGQKDLIDARAGAKAVVDAVQGKPLSAAAKADASSETSASEGQ